jgi:FK506-binding protein 2
LTIQLHLTPPLTLPSLTIPTLGTEFDLSYNGGPFTFVVGEGQVIKGWDVGLLDMCPGEKRKLTIQPEWAYGPTGIDSVIPGNSVLIFETEMVGFAEGYDENKEL